MDKTNIPWTDRSLNLMTGCSRVSEGCRHCYAEAASMLHGWTDKHNPRNAANVAVNVVLHPKRLLERARRRKPMQEPVITPAIERNEAA